MNLKKYQAIIAGLTPEEAAAKINEALAAENAAVAKETEEAVGKVLPSETDDRPSDYGVIDSITAGDNTKPNKVKAAVSNDPDFIMAQGSIVEYKKQIAILNELIEIYEIELDKQAETIITHIENGSIDFASASEIYYQYDKQWFKQAVMSADAKSQIAAAMVSAFAKYPALQSTFLRKLANSDVDAVMAVSLVD